MVESDPQPREFKRSVHAQFLSDMHQMQAENFDVVRYGYDGVDRSTIFDLGKHIQSCCSVA
jgi:hypothetical protein